MPERLPLSGSVLVTDATGFLGAYGVDGLLRLGAGMGANMLRLFRTVDRGVPMPEGGIYNRRRPGYAGSVVSRAVPVPFTTGAPERLTGSPCVDVGAPRGVGWAPRYTMAEGTADTARWYRGPHPRA